MIRTASPSGDIKSPFQSDPGTLKRQGKMRFLQVDRKMIHYIDMIRSGLIMHALASTMQRSPHRRALIRLYHSVRMLIQDDVPKADIEALHDKVFKRVKIVQVVLRE